MPKSFWGLLVTVLFAVLLTIAPIPDAWRWFGFCVCGILLLISCAGYISAHFRESVANSIKSVAEKYIENRNNTTDQESLIHLVRSGATELKSENELARLCAEIKKRTGFNPFYKWETIPEGRRLEALKRIKDRGINIDDPEQCLDFLFDFIEGSKGGRRAAQRQPIEIQYGTSPGKLMTVTVMNKGERDERVQALAIHLVHKNGKTDVVTDEKRNKPLCIKSIKRAATIPHVMEPRSSFETEWILSEGTFTAYGIKEFYATVNMEDGTIIEGPRKLITPLS